MQFANRFDSHVSMPWAGLPSGDQPVDPSQVESFERTEQGLSRNELDVRWRCA
jgi:hypothetical protein